MKKFINYILFGLILFLNISFVKAEVIDDLISKLPVELNSCYGKIYGKDAKEEKINYKVNLDNDMLYITEEKDGKTLFVDGFNFADNIISYEVFYNMDTDYQELETRNKVNYLAIFNVVAKLSGYNENYNNKILDVLEDGDFSDNGYNLTREKIDVNIKEDFKIDLKNFVMRKDLEKDNNRQGNKVRKTMGYVISTIIVIVGLSLLIYLNRDVIFGGKFFK